MAVDLVAEAEALVGEVDERVVHGMGVTVEYMAAQCEESNGRVLTKFHGVRAPNISIRDYVLRIRKFFHCSTECFVLAMVYIDRLVKRHPDVVVSPLTCHRLVLCSMMIAAKFQDDIFYKNTFYCRVGGLTLMEVNVLEKNMLQLLDYQLHVPPEEFEVYRKHICKAAEAAAARKL